MAVLPRRYLTAVIVLTLTLSSGLQSSPPDGQSGTAPPPGALAAAVHAGERDRAAQLVLDDVNGADQLFLAYLEQDLAGARTDAGQPGPLEKARRLLGWEPTVNLAEGEAAVCTFTNAADELPYTGPGPFTLALLVGGLCALGVGPVLMVRSRER